MNIRQDEIPYNDQSRSLPWLVNMLNISMFNRPNRYSSIHPKTLLCVLLTFFSQQAFAQFKALTHFGSNPGELTASYFATNQQNSDLVILLHGCAQSGEALAEQSGLVGLAQAHHFSLLVPQQHQRNNIKSCFNWFSPQDTDKNSGETLSLINMINTTKQQLSSEKVYILGLSAGGAMVSSLLVHYPELFEAGAVVAGIPYPCANNLIKAISCMRSGPSQSTTALLNEIRAINPHKSPWPKLSVWTGKEDSIVHPLNAERLANSWAQLAVPNTQGEKTQHTGYQITQWRTAQNRPYVELIELNNIDHGMSVNSQQKNGGKSGDFLLEAPISAAINIIKFWQLNKESL